MSDLLIYGLVACIVLAPLVVIYVLCGGRKATPDDLPEGDYAHHPDSIRDARRANSKDAQQ
jgi:hypothetical protein